MTLMQCDIDMLKKVYDMRCLTIKQIYSLFYKDMMSLEEFIKDRLNLLEKNKYIKVTAFAGNYAVLIDDKGYEYLKDTLLVREIVDSDSNKVKKGYNTQKENNMQPKAINHQVHLNEFVLQFEENIKKIPIDIQYNYFDEKNASKYVYMRPDGLLTVVNGKTKIDFFLEMDMATESSKQLEEKWGRYRNFISSKQFYSTDEKIVVLFIVANTEKIEERRRLILRTILSDFEKFNNRFEIYVGTKDFLLKLMFDLIINKPDYRYEIKNMLANIGIKTVSLPPISSYQNRIYEFFEVEDKMILIDTYLKEPASVLDKIQNLNYYLHTVSEKYSKKAFYLLIVDDIERIYYDLKYLNLDKVEKVLITTPDRLKEKPIHEALLSINKDGVLYHFSDTSFSNLVYENSINENESF